MWRTHTYFASQFFFFLFRVLPSFLLACPLWVVLGVIILRFRFILFDSFFLFFSRCSYCVAGVYTLWLSYPVRHGIALSNLLTSTLVLHNDALPLLCVVVRDHRAWTSLGWRLGTGAGHGVSWMSLSRRRTHACHLVYMRTCVPRTAQHTYEHTTDNMNVHRDLGHSSLSFFQKTRGTVFIQTIENSRKFNFSRGKIIQYTHVRYQYVHAASSSRKIRCSCSWCWCRVGVVAWESLLTLLAAIPRNMTILTVFSSPCSQVARQ